MPDSAGPALAVGAGAGPAPDPVLDASAGVAWLVRVDACRKKGLHRGAP